MCSGYSPRFFKGDSDNQKRYCRQEDKGCSDSLGSKDLCCVSCILLNTFSPSEQVKKTIKMFSDHV